MTNLFSRYEHKSQPLISTQEFLLRLTRSGMISLVLILLSLLIGMLGFHLLVDLSWIDAFLNAAMLLGGMGPVTTPCEWPGKLFAGFYALYCGLVVIIAAGVILTPIVHRILHRFHLENLR